ncbi:cytochrome b-c1 complex subunit 8 [Leptodontidium sp. 2 PMI_412]|nr:cytochrome b-c1 complex subunit 8 [Leptodontidium sp. 2 PMI_412]
MAFSPSSNRSRQVHSPRYVLGSPGNSETEWHHNLRTQCNRQRPLVGALRDSVFNTTRRTMGQILYVAPPLVIAYFLLDWAEKKNLWLNSKEGRMAMEEP